MRSSRCVPAFAGTPRRPDEAASLQSLRKQAYPLAIRQRLHQRRYRRGDALLAVLRCLPASIRVPAPVELARKSWYAVPRAAQIGPGCSSTPAKLRTPDPWIGRGDDGSLRILREGRRSIELGEGAASLSQHPIARHPGRQRSNFMSSKHSRANAGTGDRGGCGQAVMILQISTIMHTAPTRSPPSPSTWPDCQ
jgi:hypothetical protein